MKVLLIQPNREYYPGSFDAYGCMERSTLPLGLLYLATAIRKKHEVSILDCLMDENTRIYSRNGVLHHGLAWRHIKRRIEDFGPDVIGLTIPFTAQETAADKTLIMIKRHFPGKRVVLGGCAVSVNHEKYLSSFDGVFAITGEGELSLPLLLEHLGNPEKTRISDVPGIAYASNGTTAQNPVVPIGNLDDIGLPSYDLIDMEKYLNRRQFLAKRLSARERARMSLVFFRKGLKREDRKRDVTMFTSRGCPFNCVFCSIHSQFGFRWRAHSSGQVSGHINLLVEKYGVNFIHFEDDNLTLDRKRFHDILDRIRGEGLRIRWDAPNGVRADALDYGLLRKMRQAGCIRIYVAIESGSERVRNAVIRKNLDMKRVMAALEACRRVGISTGAFYIIGFPDETREEMLETIRLARELKAKYGTDPSMFIAQPLPGTDLLKECIESDALGRETIDPATYSIATSRISLIRGKHVSPEEVVRIRKSFIYADKTLPGKAFHLLRGAIDRI